MSTFPLLNQADWHDNPLYFWREMKFTILSVFEILEIRNLLANISLSIPFPESGTASLLSGCFKSKESYADLLFWSQILSFV